MSEASHLSRLTAHSSVERLVAGARDRDELDRYTELSERDTDPARDTVYSSQYVERETKTTEIERRV